MSDIADGKKAIFVKYLDTLRQPIYRSILSSNNVLIKDLYKKRKNSSVEGLPLWLFHGGELINLYSTEKNRVPTKDIDLKLYFTGDYSLDPKFYKQATSRIKPMHLKRYNFNDKAGCQAQLDIDASSFKKAMSRKTPSGKSYYDIWSQGEKQRNTLCANLLLNNLKGTYSQINLKTGKLRSGFEYDTLQKARSQRWTNGDDCKAFIVNIPYITQVGRDNIPYDINDKYLYSLGIEYDEEMDGYEIDEDSLERLDERFRNAFEESLVPESRRNYLMNALEILRVKHNRFKLSSVIGVVIVYNEDRGQWYLFQEGVLDTYIDYSAGHHLSLEKRYLGRYEDGSFPTTLQKVSYGNRTGIFKVPNLTWLIYDQLRMLYVTIRGEYLACDDKKCKWTTLGGGAAGNYAKYFKKLQGLLNSFEATIKALQDQDLESVGEHLRKCRGYDLEVCGFQPFLTSLFDAFQFEFMKGKRASSKKRTIKRNNKRAMSRKRTRKTHMKRSLLSDLELKESKFENI